MKVINLISLKENKKVPRFVPVINIFDISSLESWHNIAKITYVKSRRIDVIKDVCLSFHGFLLLMKITGNNKNLYYIILNVLLLF